MLVLMTVQKPYAVEAVFVFVCGFKTVRVGQLKWEFILSSENINQKLLSFHEQVMDIYQTSFPSKTRVITSENQPFFTDFLSHRMQTFCPDSNDIAA